MQIDPRYPLVRENRSMMTMYAVSDSRRTGVKVLAPGDALQITNNGMKQILKQIILHYRKIHCKLLSCWFAITKLHKLDLVQLI